MNIRFSTETWQSVTAELEKHRDGGLLLDDSKPAAIITSERYEELWHAVLAKCGELEKQHLAPGRGTRRTAGMTGPDGEGMSAILGLGQGDGTDLVFHVEAHIAPRGTIEIRYDGPWLDCHDQFWSEQASDRSNAVVVNHEHYRITPDLSPSMSDCAGFAGALFRIRMLDSGKVIESRNLWRQGVIPPSWRDRLPDNAEFIREYREQVPA